MTGTPDKLAKAEERFRRAKARLESLKKAAAESDRRRDNSRKFLLGAAVLAWHDSGKMPAEVRAGLRAFLAGWLQPGDPRVAALQGSAFSPAIERTADGEVADGSNT